MDNKTQRENSERRTMNHVNVHTGRLEIKFILFSTANPLFFRISATVTTVAMAGNRTINLVSFA
jgi:hypothetical protein